MSTLPKKSDSSKKGEKNINNKPPAVVDEDDGDDGEEDEDAGEGDEEGEDGDDEEIDLPPSILKRVLALRKLQTGIEEIDTEYKAERALLEAKFKAKKDVVYEQRREIVNGLVEPEEEKDESAPESAQPAEEATDADDIKGVPNFWLQAIGNHPMIADLITEEDIPALSSLEDIKCDYNESYTSFTLSFFFKENEFFTNTVLTKKYTLSPDLMDEKPPSLVESESSGVEWKTGKNLCVTEVKKKQKAKSGKNKGQTRTIVQQKPKSSFFHYFSQPKPDDEEEEDEEEEKERIQLTEEEDFEVAHTLRTLIIPEAVMWFTGEAEDENYSPFEEGDEEEDDEEGDDEDDDEDDEEEAPRPTKSKAGKNKGGFASGAAPTAGAGGEQPECKQN